MCKYLITHQKMDPHATGPNLLLLAAQNGATNVIKYLVDEHKFDLTWKNKHRDDALILSLKSKRDETAAYLISSRKFDLLETHKRTGLNYFGYAVSKGQFKHAKMMLDQLRKNCTPQQVEHAINAGVSRVKKNGLTETTPSLMQLCYKTNYYPGMLFLAEECNIELPEDYLKQHQQPEESSIEERDSLLDALSKVDSVLGHRRGAHRPLLLRKSKDLSLDERERAGQQGQSVDLGVKAARKVDINLAKMNSINHLKMLNMIIKSRSSPMKFTPNMST